MREMIALNKNSGVTLFELMIAVAIVGILAAIAYPSYNEAMRKSRRSAAISNLVDLQLQQEKWRAINTTYTTAINLNLPANDFYTFDVPINSATNYTIRATANAGIDQANDKQFGTSCTPLTITRSGTKNPADCFRD